MSPSAKSSRYALVGSSKKARFKNVNAQNLAAIISNSFSLPMGFFVCFTMSRFNPPKIRQNTNYAGKYSIFWLGHRAFYVAGNAENVRVGGEQIRRGAGVGKLRYRQR